MHPFPDLAVKQMLFRFGALSWLEDHLEAQVLVLHGTAFRERQGPDSSIEEGGGMLYRFFPLHENDKGFLGDVLRIARPVATAITDQTGIERGKGLVKLGYVPEGGFWFGEDLHALLQHSNAGRGDEVPKSFRSSRDSLEHMSDPLQQWRDALQDLGVFSLVPEPQEEPEVATVQAPAEQSRPKEDRIPIAPSTDPAVCPPLEAVASTASLDLLKTCIQDCLACPLGAGRIRFVFGEGDPAARMLFIGEGPGRDEDLQGRPFVGKAGELLEKMLAAIGYQRQDVYITNIVKCRPPDNRTPTPQEAQRCLPYLKRQIELLRPGVIVTLGATPLRELLGVLTGITRIRGQWQRLEMLGGIPVMPTFHPAYVLRQYTQDVRRAVWEDLKAARAWLDQHPK